MWLVDLDLRRARVWSKGRGGESYNIIMKIRTRFPGFLLDVYTKFWKGHDHSSKRSSSIVVQLFAYIICTYQYSPIIIIACWRLATLVLVLHLLIFFRFHDQRRFFLCVV